MKTLKVLLQEVVSGIKAWVNSNFAQESNTVHKTGNETVNGDKTLTGSNTFTDIVSISKSSNSGLRLYNNAVNISANSGQPNMSVNDSQGFISFKGNSLQYALCDFTVSPRLTYSQTRLVTRYFTNSSSYNAVGIDLAVDSSNNKSVTPTDNNQVNLGTANYQWNNVYAKTYYYNGTVWGLDKANFWTNTNKFYGITITGHSGIRWLRDGYTAGTLPETIFYYGFQNAYDSNEDVFDRIRSYISTTGGNMREHYKYAWGDLSKYIHKGFWISNDGSDSAQQFLVNRVIPETDGATDLGTSTNRWKTLNGLNPGVLSLPDLSDPDPINTSTWVTDTPTNNAYTPSEDGWLNVVTSHATSSLFSVYIKSGDFYVSTYSALEDIDDNTYKSGLFVPVLAGQTYYIVFKGNLTLTVDATFYPAKGNV